ncbi:MAG TPA: thiamine pyrophosphate-binding protein [Candidatus Binataceae bacterium]|nr:thiamine pyrophosphate-binding protein [Candidatus Binataceae bacterium]
MATNATHRRAARSLLTEEVSPSEAIVRVLEQAGINMVFGMPGGNMGAVFNALYDHRETVRSVLVREEARAGVMAEVYGRLSGRPGVVIAQGAFLANVSLGAIEAHLSSSPMLLMGDLSDHAPYSNHSPYQSGAGEYGTWDARGLFASITKLTMVANNPAHAVQSTEIAIKHALSGQRGPVAVLYHSQALRGRVGPETRPHLYALDSYLPGAPARADGAAVREAAQLLLDAERPLIIAGNGVRISGAYEEVAALAAKLGAPVSTTAGGKGTFAETHELALGVCGNFGTPLANAEIGAADVILAIGTRLSVTDFANQNPKLLDPRRQTLIQIDIETRNASWTFPAEIALIGDAGAVVSQVSEALDAAGPAASDKIAAARSRLQRARREHGFFDAPELRSDEAPILPQRAIAELQRAVPNDAIITCDAGENRIFMTHYFQTKGPATFLQPSGVGGMGYAIPAAMAAKLVHRDRDVVAVCGDGGFAIGMNGLMTALAENIPITVVVFNNGALGWVKHGQGERNIACDLSSFDHAAIARSMGCCGIRVEDPRQLGAALKQAMASETPTVVDVQTSINESFRRVTSPLAMERA